MSNIRNEQAPTVELEEQGLDAVAGGGFALQAAAGRGMDGSGRTLPGTDGLDIVQVNGAGDPVVW